MIANFPTNPYWRRLYLAAVISVAGNQFTRIVLFVKVHSLGGEIEGLTTVALAQALPALFVSPIAGTLAQRWGKRNFLIASDLARCILLVGIAATGSLLTLYIIAALVAASSAIFDPVESALEADYLPNDEMLHANAWRTSTLQLLAIIGLQSPREC